MQKSCSYYRGIFYCPVATTGEYLRENHQFRVWESRKSNFLYFPFDRTSWDKYMFNGNISMKFYDMSHFVRSNGKETVQRAHCALLSSRIQVYTFQMPYLAKFRIQIKYFSCWYHLHPLYHSLSSEPITNHTFLAWKLYNLSSRKPL